MNEQGHESPSADRPGTRYEATLHLGPEGAVDLERVADLDIDRIQGAEGEVRVLVDLAAAARLVEMGFEVRLVRALPVRPLDPGLIASDDDVRAWLEERIRGAEGEEAP